MENSFGLDSVHKMVRERRTMARGGCDHVADGYENGELVLAALAYLVTPGDEVWPFEPEDFLPGDPEDNMVKAGAFLAAEGDRIRRARLAGNPVSSGLIVLGMDPNDVDRCVDGLRNIRSEMLDIRDSVSDFPDQ